MRECVSCLGKKNLEITTTQLITGVRWNSFELYYSTRCFLVASDVFSTLDFIDKLSAERTYFIERELSTISVVPSRMDIIASMSVSVHVSTVRV